MTIHNIAFQGRFDRSIFNFLGLPARGHMTSMASNIMAASAS